MMEKLDKVLKDVSLRAAVQKKTIEHTKEEKRNLSENANNIRKRLAKIEMKRFIGPFRLR
jgi:hypothetical protein